MSGIGPFATTIAAMCGECSHVVAAITCPRGWTLPRAMCGQCPHVIAVIACDYQGSSPFATVIAAMCGQCSHIIAAIACVRRGIEPFRYYYDFAAMCGQCSRVIACDCCGSCPSAILSPRCVIGARTSSLSSLVIVRERNLLLLLSLWGMFVPGVMFACDVCYRLHVVAVIA